MEVNDLIDQDEESLKQQAALESWVSLFEEPGNYSKGLGLI